MENNRSDIIQMMVDTLYKQLCEENREVFLRYEEARYTVYLIL